MRKVIISIIIILAGIKNVFAQGAPGFLTGRVLDEKTSALIEYANIILLSTQDSSMITGTVTDVKGVFVLNNIREGKFILEVKFLGYSTCSYTVSITREVPSLDLGDIYIQPDAVMLNDIVVRGDRIPVSYQIDKKVIDVDKIQTVISGNAADVLQNVPSVTVDIEGNVSLRGSTNFTVLVDGRPSIMSAQDVLQQIPASSIETIEIITNPSAKYDPEGTAGIINIILKKYKNLGFSGIINANVGLNNTFGGDFLFQYKTSDLTYTFGLDYNKRNFPGSSIRRNEYYKNDSTSFFYYNGNNEWSRTGLGIRAGVEFNIDESNFLSIVGRFGTRDGGRNSNQYLSNWTSVQPLILVSNNLSKNTRGGEFAGTNLSYNLKLPGKGHEIKAEFNFRYNDGKDSAFTETTGNSVLLDGKKTTEFGPSRDFETKIDYILPISEQNKFEAGYENEIENSDELNEFFEYDSNSSAYIFRPLFSNSTKYKNNDQAFYAIYSDQYDNLGLQGGLRVEYTYREIALLNLNNSFTIDRWDFFPTIHFSYKFSELTQIMASYTRRIQRPHGWELEPFYTWVDANNIRIGNPDLLPELIDSYEAGFQSYIGSVSFSTEIYHRVTNNKTERIISVYPAEPDVSLNSVANIGSDYSTGAELMVILDPFKFWNVNLMFNLYDYRIKGVLYNEPFVRTSFNWNGRLNNMFILGPNTQLQLNINYNSPSISSQGRWEESYSADVSAKQVFFEKLLSLTLQVRDIFGTAKHESTSSGRDFYSYNLFERQSPILVLNARINFNNYKAKRDKDNLEPRDEGVEF